MGRHLYHGRQFLSNYMTVSRHGTNELLATPLVRNVSAARNMHAGLNHPPSLCHAPQLWAENATKLKNICHF